MDSEARRFAADVYSGRSARIILDHDNDEGRAVWCAKRVLQRRELDTQFHRQAARFPGVVVEVSYPQQGKDLDKLAWDRMISCS